MVHFLLEYGASPFLENALGGFALYHEVSGGHEEVFETLLHHLGNSRQPEAKNQLNVALGIAARDGRHQMIRKSLDQGAEINQPTRDNPLARAARRRRLETTDVLLENGAKPNVMSPDGDSAFSAAVESGDIPLVQFLIDQGAPLEYLRMCRRRLMSCLDCASTIVEDDDMVQLLLKTGVREASDLAKAQLDD